MEGIDEYFDDTPRSHRGRRATELLRLHNAMSTSASVFIRPNGNMDVTRTKKHVQYVLAPLEKKYVVLAWPER